MVIFITLMTVIIDQFTKYKAVKYLKGRGPYKLIENIFSLYYYENRGAAFGILQERRILFLVITSLVIALLIYYIYINNKKMSKLNKFAFGMFLGGTIGNLIDRFRLGYVIDFLSFKFFESISFPIFNVADVFIIISTIIIMIMIIFDDSKKVIR